MQKLVLAVLVGLGVTVTPARGADQQCMFDQESFPSGSVSCQRGQQFLCVSGGWKGTGLGCADENAHGDEPGIHVAPGVRDPVVQQPAPPSQPHE
jgi:hypothetical protein